MNEYRCTRNTPFGFPCAKTSPNYKYISARQGHYIHAFSSEDAYIQLIKMFPEDSGEKTPIETFTVHFNKDVSSHYVSNPLSEIRNAILLLKQVYNDIQLGSSNKNETLIKIRQAMQHTNIGVKLLSEQTKR